MTLTASTRFRRPRPFDIEGSAASPLVGVPVPFDRGTFFGDSALSLASSVRCGCTTGRTVRKFLCRRNSYDQPYTPRAVLARGCSTQVPKCCTSCMTSAKKKKRGGCQPVRRETLPFNQVLQLTLGRSGPSNDSNMQPTYILVALIKYLVYKKHVVVLRHACNAKFLGLFWAQGIRVRTLG